MSIVLFAPKRFSDSRGWFSETYNAHREIGAGIAETFVQDNQSYSSSAGTIRGIHFQRPPHAQAKLVRCLRGAVMDYAIDLRHQSPTYGKYVCAELTSDNGHQLFIPAGFGHAFITLEAATEISYKVNDYYAPDCDRGIRWNCPDIAIDWPLEDGVVLSDKDAALPTLAHFVSPFAFDGSPMELVIRT